MKPPGPLDDPCPSGSIFLNCSQSCGTGRDEANCSIAECGPSMQHFVISDPTVFPITIRTPANPGTITNCNCPPFYSYGTAVYGIEIRFDYSKPAAPYNYKYYKVTVAPPWRLHRADGSSDFPLSDQPCQYGPDGCEQIIASGQGAPNPTAVYITTADPNAPARNVLIEPFYAFPSCL